MLQYRRGNQQMHLQANISFMVKSKISIFSAQGKLKKVSNIGLFLRGVYSKELLPNSNQEE